MSINKGDKMQNPSPTQRKILLDAANSVDGYITKWPSNLKGASIQKVVDSLLSKGFIVEVVFEETPEATMYQITQEGRNTLNLEPNLPEEPKEATPTLKGKSPRGKLGIIFEMLQREQGATLQEVVDRTGWKGHTARGAISGQINKKWGFSVEKIVNTQRQKAYKIAIQSTEIKVPE